MKILYSHRTKSADGQYVHIRSMTEALVARGHKIIMCGPEDQNAGYKNLDAGNPSKSSPTALLPKPVYELAELAYSVKGYSKLNRLASETGPDIFYERYNLFYHAGVRVSRARKLPFILEVNAPLAAEREKHDGLSLKSLARWSETSIWQAADAILPVTNVLADQLRAAGVDDGKISVIQNGVEPEFLSDHDGSKIRAKYQLENKTVLGFTGFVRDWHGVDRVLDFMSTSDRPDLHLLLVGDGPAKDKLLSQAERLGLLDHFTVTGVIQRSEMPDHVAAFDIALQPAVVDYASPLKLFEYMALEKPILAPNNSNIQEILRHDMDGYLFDRHDKNALIAGMQRLVESHELRQRLGAQAKQSLLRQKFTWSENALRVERIAEKLIELSK